MRENVSKLWQGAQHVRSLINPEFHLSFLHPQDKHSLLSRVLSSHSHLNAVSPDASAKPHLS